MSIQCSSGWLETSSALRQIRFMQSDNKSWTLDCMRRIALLESLIQLTRPSLFCFAMSRSSETGEPGKAFEMNTQSTDDALAAWLECTSKDLHLSSPQLISRETLASHIPPAPGRTPRHCRWLEARSKP
jgi:hypothetical protein